MDLKQMAYFVAVAEELHFSRAAVRVRIAQPALSQQIQQLEQELGGALLIRNKRNVSLTEAGAVFLSEAKTMLMQAEHAKTVARQAFSGIVGELSVGFVEAATWSALPQVVAAYRTQYPQVKLTLQHLNTAKQIQALQNRNIHVGIIGLPIDNPALSFHLIAKEPYWVALPPGHRLADKSDVFVSDLVREQFVFTNREAGPLYYDKIVKVCLDAGFSPEIIQSANEMLTVLSLVSCGMGIALIHESAKNLRSDLIYKRLLGTDQSAYQLSFVWEKANIPPTLQGFLKIIEKYYSSTNST